MKIIKRSGSEAVYDSNKIIAAVQKANASVIDYEKLSDEQIREIADNVETACENMKRSPSVEEIQDMVENQLMNKRALRVTTLHTVTREHSCVSPILRISRSLVFLSATTRK